MESPAPSAATATATAVTTVTSVTSNYAATPTTPTTVTTVTTTPILSMSASNASSASAFSVTSGAAATVFAPTASPLATRQQPLRPSELIAQLTGASVSKTDSPVNQPGSNGGTAQTAATATTATATATIEAMPTSLYSHSLEDIDNEDDDLGFYDDEDEDEEMDRILDGNAFIQPEDLDENATVDFDCVYALFDYIGTVEGQLSVNQGDRLILLDDSNSYWWLVQHAPPETETDENETGGLVVNPHRPMGYTPADNVETPSERLARINKMKNMRLTGIMSESDMNNPGQLTVTKQPRQLPPGSSGVEFVDGFVTLEFEAYHGASASESMLYGSDDSDAEDDSYMDEIDRSSALGSNDEIARGMGSSSASDIKNLANGSMDSVLLGAAVPRSDIAMPADHQQQQQSTLSEAIQAIDELDRHQPSVIGELEEFGNTPEVGTRLDARLSLRLTYADAVGNETSGLIDAQPMDTFDQLLRRAVAVHAPEYIDVAPETFQMLAYMDDMRYGVVLDPNEQLATVLNYLGESASQVSSRLQLQLKHKSSSSTPTPQQQPQQPQQHLQVPGTPTKASNDGDTENETPRPTPRSPDPREAVSKALWRISAPSGPPPSTIAAKRRSIFSSDDVSKLNQDISLVTAVDDSKLSTPVEASGSNGNAQLAAYSEEELSKPVAHTFKRNNITVPHTLPKSPQSPTFSQHRHQSSESTDTSIILSDDDWLVILHGWDSRLDYQAHHHPYDIAYINDKTGEPAYFHAPEEPKLLRDWDQFAELSRTVGGHLDSLGMDLDGMVANLTRRWT